MIVKTFIASRGAYAVLWLRLPRVDYHWRAGGKSGWRRSGADTGFDPALLRRSRLFNSEYLALYWNSRHRYIGDDIAVDRADGKMNRRRLSWVAVSFSSHSAYNHLGQMPYSGAFAKCRRGEGVDCNSRFGPDFDL